MVSNQIRERVRATKDAPGGPYRLLEYRHGLAEIVERGAVVLVKRPRVIRPRGGATIVGKLPGSQISGSVITEISMVITREWKLLVIWEV